jgi:hypothetical protein
LLLHKYTAQGENMDLALFLVVNILIQISVLVTTKQRWLKYLNCFAIGTMALGILLWYVPASPLIARWDAMEAKHSIAQQPQERHLSTDKQP